RRQGALGDARRGGRPAAGDRGCSRSRTRPPGRGGRWGGGGASAPRAGVGAGAGGGAGAGAGPARAARGARARTRDAGGGARGRDRDDYCAPGSARGGERRAQCGAGDDRGGTRSAGRGGGWGRGGAGTPRGGGGVEAARAREQGLNERLAERERELEALRVEHASDAASAAARLEALATECEELRAGPAVAEAGGEWPGAPLDEAVGAELAEEVLGHEPGAREALAPAGEPASPAGAAARRPTTAHAPPTRRGPPGAPLVED